MIYLRKTYISFSFSLKNHDIFYEKHTLVPAVHLKSHGIFTKHTFVLAFHLKRHYNLRQYTQILALHLKAVFFP